MASGEKAEWRDLAQLVDRMEKLRTYSRRLREWARELKNNAKAACGGAASLFDQAAAARKRASRQWQRVRRRSRPAVRLTSQPR